MKNKYIHKKLKYTLALNVVWNISKHHNSRRETMLWAFKQFQTPPTNRYMTSIEEYSYHLANRIAYQRGMLWLTRATIIDYAKEHGIIMYDMRNGETVHAE